MCLFSVLYISENSCLPGGNGLILAPEFKSSLNNLGVCNFIVLPFATGRPLPKLKLINYVSKR